MRARLVSALGIIVSLIAIFYLVQQFDLQQSQEILKEARLNWLGLAAIAYLGLFPLRGLRWSWLLSDIRPVATRISTETFIVGAMANNILPARLGDLVRAYVLSRQANIPATTTFSNVLLERIIDGCTVIALLAGVLLLAPPDSQDFRLIGSLMAIIFFGAFVACLLLAVAPKLFWTLLDPFLGQLPAQIAGKLKDRLFLLLEGLNVLRRPALMTKILVVSVLVWILEATVYMICQKAFGMQIPFSGLILVMSVLTLGLTAPSGPGFIGVFEGLILAGTLLYGIEQNTGLAFAIAIHLIHYVPVTVIGLGIAWRMGIKVTKLGETAQENAVAPSEGN